MAENLNSGTKTPDVGALTGKSGKNGKVNLNSMKIVEPSSGEVTLAKTKGDSLPTIRQSQNRVES